MKNKILIIILIIEIIFIADKVNAYEKYNIGKEINYNNQKFYVIEESDDDTDYITLLKENPLTNEELNRYKGDSQNSSYAAKISYINERVYGSSFMYPYDESNPKPIIDYWLNNEINSDDLVEVDGYKARLLNNSDMSSLGYEAEYEYQQNGPEVILKNIKFIPQQGSSKKSWLDYNGEKMLTSFVYYFFFENTNYVYVYFPAEDEFNSTMGTTDGIIRPVINIKKSVLGSRTDYNVGDEITYRNERYNVVQNSNSDLDYVVALKYEPLTQATLNATYNISEGLTSFYSSDSCGYQNTSGCTNDYNQSNVKKIVDNWASDNIKSSDLVSVKGYKTRIITAYDLIDNLGYTLFSYGTGPDENYLKKTENTPEFMYNLTKPYWIMTTNEDLKVANNVLEHTDKLMVYELSQIRPVIYLNKCIFGDEDERCKTKKILACEEGTTPIYEKKPKYVGMFNDGQIITINNEKYVVIGNVTKKAKTIKLLRLNTLTPDQINTYSNGEYQSTDGEIPFNTKCYNNMDYSYEHREECTDYNSSLIKTIVDNWAKETFIDSFINSHLISFDELRVALKYEIRKSFTPSGDISMTFHASDETPTEILEKYTYFTSGIYSSDIRYFSDYNTLSNIRPVIEIDKCSVEGGCEYEDVLTGCLTPDGKIIPVDPKEEVEVENTLSTMSKITIIISMIFIVIGLFIYLYNINKIKNEKN